MMDCGVDGTKCDQLKIYQLIYKRNELPAQGAACLGAKVFTPGVRCALNGNPKDHFYTTRYYCAP
jgi:hypothetical protein